VVVRPARDLAEALLAGELLRSTYDQSASPAYLEHLRDVGPRMALAELLVAVDGHQVIGSVTYARAGTPFALVSVEGEGELRMLGVVEHRGKARTEELLVEACIERAERDGCPALVMSSVRKRSHSAGKTFQRMGFRLIKGRELSPMPGLTLEVFSLALPRERQELRTTPDRPGRWRRGLS
jgi:predicted N-acetyltransferase YhbS